MQGLYIASTAARSGKNLVTLALGVHLQRCGVKVGYFKPLGNTPALVDERLGDADALLTQEVLGQELTADLLTPVVVPDNLRAAPLGLGVAEAVEKIRYAYAQASLGRDLMLVEGFGAFPEAGRFCGADAPSLVRDLDLKVILVEKVTPVCNYDAILYARDLLGAALLGVVFNNIDESMARDTGELLIPFLAQEGIQTLGCVPHEPELAAIKTAELTKGLGGRVVAGNSHSHNSIKGFLIGTMQVDNFISHLARQPNNAVIVGGDRTDLQLMALQGNCACLVLTGNMTPDDIVRTRADALGIPIIVVKEDTYTVARKMERILEGQKLEELSKIKTAVRLVVSALDLPLLYHQLALQGEKHV